MRLVSGDKRVSSLDTKHFGTNQTHRVPFICQVVLTLSQPIYFMFPKAGFKHFSPNKIKTSIHTMCIEMNVRIKSERKKKVNSKTTSCHLSEVAVRF